MSLIERTDGWERCLYIAIGLTFFFLLFIQVLYTLEPFRFHLNSTERLEGVAWSSGGRSGVTGSVLKAGKIEIELMEQIPSPRVYVLINGRRAASLANRRVVVGAREGDEVMIDGSRYDGFLTFRVRRLSSQILWPPSDYLVTTCSSCVGLGRVKIKKYGGWGD